MTVGPLRGKCVVPPSLNRMKKAADDEDAGNLCSYDIASRSDEMKPNISNQNFFPQVINNSMKKRKNFELHFPPTKSRRLDSELMEEDTMPMPLPKEETERALVLYLKSPDFSFLLNSHFIPAFNDYMLSWGTTKLDDLVEDKVRREKSSEVSKDCLAVIPWVAFHSPMVCEEIVPESGQPLEEENGEMMEMDESCVNNNNEKAMEIVEKVEATGASSPWQQQHSMMLNLLKKTSTPIQWC